MSAKTGVVLAVGVLACLSGVALAEERPSSVTVAATGTVHAKPDVARFVVVLQEQDDKVEKAVKDLEGSLEKFLTQLAALEGAPVEVKVSEPSVYVYRPGGALLME